MMVNLIRSVCQLHLYQETTTLLFTLSLLEEMIESEGWGIANGMGGDGQMPSPDPSNQTILWGWRVRDLPWRFRHTSKNENFFLL